MTDHDDHDHDKGLSHDLPQLVRRGLGRRGMLGIVGGVGVATLAGCALGDDGSSTASTPSDRPSPPAGGPPAGGMGARVGRRGRRRRDPRGDRRAVPGRRLQRPQRAERVGSGAQRHHLELRVGVGGGRGRAADPPVPGLRPGRRGRRRRWPAPRSTPGTATGRATTRCTTATPSTRTTCAACRRPTRTGGWSSRRSSRPATPGAGRTSTSRSTSPRQRHERVDEAAHLPARVPRGRVRRGLRDRRLRAVRRQPGPDVSLDSDGIFSDGYSLQMAKVTGSVSDGYVATLNVPV